MPLTLQVFEKHIKVVNFLQLSDPVKLHQKAALEQTLVWSPYSHMVMAAATLLCIASARKENRE